MARRQSAGLLVYRFRDSTLQVLLVHPGGPFWQRKDDGAWSIPKGEFVEGEETPIAAARREFAEETGFAIEGEAIPLAPLRQASGKVVHPFALEGDFDVAQLRSNPFSMEWPPRSGRVQAFPEVDRAQWFALDDAARKLLRGQLPMLAELADLLARRA